MTANTSRIARLAIAAIVACAPPLSASAASTCATLPGMNIAGGEFNANKKPGTFAKDYIYPSQKEFDLAKKLQLKLVRVPFLWERLQQDSTAPLDPAELKRIDAVVGLATTNGLTVILDLHNYGTYRGIALPKMDGGTAALADFWKRLAQHFAGNDHVVFGMMNEPHDITTDEWAAIAGPTLAAIRSTGARNIVLIPGTHWDGAHSWQAPLTGRSNADALLPLAAGDDRVVFEVHQYFDDNYSGTAETCNAAPKVPDALKRVADWARKNQVRLFLGEFGVSRRDECVKALDDALKTVEHDSDVWYGWTYWSAGAWWGNYPFNIQAQNGDTPQGQVLAARASRLDAGACKPDQ